MERPRGHGEQDMEQTNAETWDCWLTEDFKLDSDSPMDISDPLWGDEAPSNDPVARSLFVEGTPSGMTEGSLQTSNSWDDLPIASEGFLNLLSEDHVSSSPGRSRSFEGCDGSLSACEDMPSSTSSMWFMSREDSLSSSVSVALVDEQSAESWMAKCFNDNDGDDAHAQLIIQCSGIVRDNIVPSFPSTRAHSQLKSSAMHVGPLCKIREGQRGARTSQEFLASQHDAKPKKIAISRGKQAPTKRLVQSVSDSQVVYATTKPVVYPFALVKPCGIQGDATLKDINERINTVSLPLSMPSNAACPSTSSPFLGKPVVAVTKIHTEGNGTITIMRTRR